jgi:type I restriction enzyme S subunit
MSWDSLKIGDFAEVITGGTPSTAIKEYWDNGTIPWLNSGELNEDIVTKSENFITVLGLQNSAARLMPIDTVLIALTGATTGVVGYLTIEACANQSVTGILPSKKHHPKYLYYYLKSIRSKVLNDSYGGAQKHISQGYVKELQIPLPPLPIQKRIAEILDAADALKRKDQELLKKYDELAQAIFIDMFGDPVKNEKGWEVKTIGEVCHYVKDGPHVSPKYTESGIPFISVNNIIKGSIDLSNSKYISQSDFEMYSKKGKPERNDMLYTKGGTTGFAKRVDVDYDFVQWVHVALLKFDQNILNSIFFEYMLNSAYCYHQSQLLTKGIANRDLVLGEIKKITILFPPIKTQEDFAERVCLNENMKKIQEKTNSESLNLFNTLIQKAFNGELVN